MDSGHGDEKLFELTNLFETRWLHARAFRVGVPPDLRDEVVNQVVLNVISAMQGGAWPANLKAYCTEALRHESFRQVNSRRLEVSLTTTSGEGEQHELDVPDRREGPEDLLLRAESVEAVHRALQTLTPAHREILWRHSMLDESYAEIADMLGITEVAARVRSFRALRLLQERLGQQFPREV